MADAGVDVDLFSLFPPTGSVVHQAAERWLPALRQGRLGGGMAGLAWWLWRRPARVLSSLLAIARGYWRRPTLAARALVTFVIACGHARSLVGANVGSHPRPLRDLSRACGLALLAPHSAPVQLHRACSRPLRRSVDARAEGPGRQFRGRDLGVQPAVPGLLRGRARGHRGPGGSLRNRSRCLRIPTALRAAGGPGRCSLRRQPSGVQGPRGSAHGPRHQHQPRASSPRSGRTRRAQATPRAARGATGRRVAGAILQAD